MSTQKYGDVSHPPSLPLQPERSTDETLVYQIAFDAGQKAVLTSCVLINQSALSRKVKRSGNKGEREKAKQREDCMINVSFNFSGFECPLVVATGFDDASSRWRGGGSFGMDADQDSNSIVLFLLYDS